MSYILSLAPIAIFFAVLLLVGYRVNLKNQGAKSFQLNYLLGDRSLGGIVLAMTLVATYGSVSSFISGPGVAWNLGFGWVVFAAPQIICGFLILGVLGKKLSVLSRKTGAMTIIDIIYARFPSHFLAALLSLMLVIFFTAMAVGQFIGGAQIFAAFTGFNYKAGLILFAVVTVIYSSAGFKAVAITDAVCAFLMLLGMFILGACILHDGGGLENIMHTISAVKVQDGVSANLTVTAHGALPYTLLFSAWILVGFGTIGLPQSQVRLMSYKRTEDLHRAMLVGTIVCGALMIGMTMLGVLARGVITELPENGTDSIIPTLIITHLHPVIAGITVLGPLAATMSTVSSLFIAAASAILRDLHLHLKFDPAKQDLHIRKASKPVTYLIGLICILLALYPQDIVVWVNLFAFGGLETAFLWPVVLGLFCSRINTRGALLGVLGGMIVYILCMIFKVNIAGFHNIVFGLLAGLIFTLIGAATAPRSDAEIIRTFFPHKAERILGGKA